MSEREEFRIKTIYEVTNHKTFSIFFEYKKDAEEYRKIHFSSVSFGADVREVQLISSGVDLKAKCDALQEKLKLSADRFGQLAHTLEVLTEKRESNSLPSQVRYFQEDCLSFLADLNSNT